MSLKYIFFIIFLISCSNKKEVLRQFEGNWKVKKIKSLIPGVYNGMEDDLKTYNDCINSNVEIKNKSIIFEEKSCVFFNCNEITENFQVLKVINDKPKEISFHEISQNKKIGKILLDQIDINLSQKEIKTIFTNCPTGYGNEKVKIFILNEDEIVIFQYYNFIVLERKA